MANKNLFKSSAPITAKSVDRTAKNVTVTNAVNNAGGVAYLKTQKNTLSQIAATNCFNGTYYVSAEENLNLAKKAALALKSDPAFIAKVALYCRNKAYMKDMPAFLVAYLATIDSKLFRKVFPIVIDNVKMLRTFIQIGRSGAVGKTINMSSGTVRHAIRDWFASKSPEFIFKGSIGNDPSMRDVLRMSRPKPENATKAALYAYLKDSEFSESEGVFITRNKDKSVKYSNRFFDLPKIVKEYEAFKKNPSLEVPKLDFRMLDSICSKEQLKNIWKSQAETGSWTITRMNLNNFAKYGVFDDPKMVDLVSSRLVDKKSILDAKAYPYQLMMAYSASDATVPMKVRNALQDAMEIALENVPKFNGKTVVCVDTSGSMSSPVTGNRGTATSSVTCIQVAALFAAAILRKNPEAVILPFDTSVHSASSLNPRDSVMTNASKLQRFGGGGTDCGAALRHVNNLKQNFDNVIFISDNESWAGGYSYSRGTGLMNEWLTFLKKNKDAKLVCIDLTPSRTSQVDSNSNILQVGGFGDQVFDVVNSFIEHGNSSDHWSDVIDSVSLD